MRKELFWGAVSCLGIATSCSDGVGVARIGARGTPTPQPTSAAGEISLEFQSPPSVLRARPTGQETCVSVTVLLKVGSAVQVGKEVEFKVAAAEGATAPTTTVTEAKVKSGEDGVASAEICTGSTEESILISAQWEAKKVTTSKIQVVNELDYTFAFDKVVEHGDSTGVESTIPMTLQDAGEDCLTLRYKLFRGTAPVAGAEAEFVSGVDFPVGFKLAQRSDAGQKKQDTATGKSVAVYKVKSNEQGFFLVPACSGTAAGNTTIKGSFVDDDGVAHAAASPALSIAGGLASYDSFSLTFDMTNARTLVAYFNNDSTVEHPFIINVGARNQAPLVKTYPVGIVQELGRISIAENGIINFQNTVPFTMRFLNLGATRPFPVNAGYSNQCDPTTFSSPVSFRELNKNWRSTIVYYVKGQEQFYDANNNGKYDLGGDGFWDKNQNGSYDPGIDELTFDAGGDGQVDVTKEWFIDLPSPFVDRNENGQHDTGETIVGDTFSAPNGIWDPSTTIWKSLQIPVYVGLTEYSVTHTYVSSNASNYALTPAFTSYLASVGVTGAERFNAAYTVPAAGASSFTRYVLAQDKCGSPLPGGSRIRVMAELPTGAGDPSPGPRKPTFSLSTQPGDGSREPNYQLLKSASGAGESAEGVLNFNIPDHPASAAGFPVFFTTNVPACSAFVSNADSSSRYCTGQTWKIVVEVEDPLLGATLSFPTTLDVPEYKSVTCDEGFVWSTASKTCVAQ